MTVHALWPFAPERLLPERRIVVRLAEHVEHEAALAQEAVAPDELLANGRLGVGRHVGHLLQA